MWVKRFNLKSYSSFEDSDWINLNPGFNVFVGANNSGKTSLLRSFAKQLQDWPHRSADRYRGAQLQKSSMEIDVSGHLYEIMNRFSIANGRATFSVDRTNEQVINRFLSDRNRICTIEAIRIPGGAFSARTASSIAELASSSGNVQQCQVRPVEDHWEIETYTGNQANIHDILNMQEYPYVFYFEPQRLHVGSSPYSDQRVLNTGASNLPNVLLHLQSSRPHIFRRIVNHVAEVSQSIHSISAAPNGGDIEIILWPSEDQTRPELSFRLSESGTGIGQIIAIITAAATSEQCTIVVDEINTFLHPSATKRLISILKSEYGQHQYIVSTHSSDVVCSIGAETIKLIRKHGFQSKITDVSPTEVSGVRTLASELGFSMMDVFGHERLIWVEGETEQIVFPYLLRAASKPVPEGVGVSTVSSASDFQPDSRSVRSITEIYQHIAESAAPLLKGLAFGLDREGHSDETIERLELSKRKLRFLPRRMLECYALQPAAIAKAISDADGTDIDEQAVQSFLSANGRDLAYRARSAWNGDLQSSAWLKKVDGAKLLGDCFIRLTETRTEFRKTRDTLKIIQQIFDADPLSLKELTDYIDLLIRTSLRDTSA